MADSSQLNNNGMNIQEDFPAGAATHDVNFNPEVSAKIGQSSSGHDILEQEGMPPVPDRRFAQEHATPMDPMMRQAYARPPAGFTMPQNMDQSPSRNYKMASDIFGTGMDRSWSASPGSSPTTPKGVSINPITGAPTHVPSSVPRSFKITEMPSGSNGGNNDEQSGLNPAGRRARESSGNPLTGQGFDAELTKTGKRYFEGSNANQKLW